MLSWVQNASEGNVVNPVASTDTTRFNVSIMERSFAYEFLAFCNLNAQACSVVSVGEVGDPVLKDLRNIDLRTASNSYDIFENGKLARQARDLIDIWKNDFLGIAIGCSLALDTLLLEQGIVPKHIRKKARVPVLKTALRARSVGVFSSHLMVTMRVFREHEVARVCQVSARYPVLHGGPVHIGDREAIGASMEPVLGDPIEPEKGEVALYWGCGVTAVSALVGASLPIAITNSDMHLCSSAVSLHSLAIF